MQIHTRIPQDVLDAIDALAAERGVPRAHVIRELLRQGVEREAQRPSASELKEFAEFVGEYVVDAWLAARESGSAAEAGGSPFD